jgi:glycosyltransferase involved in cell wall biosynthesis
MWAKDLAMHTTYIEHLTLAAPRFDANPPASFIPWDSCPLRNIQIVDLPPFPNIWATVTRFPVFVVRLWKAVAQADVVHGHVAGWPMPDGWLTVPLARMRRRFVIIVVESDFWRLTASQNASIKQKWQSVAYEILNRWCIGLAHLAFFTHEDYLRTLLTRHTERGHVIPASWIDDTFVLSDQEARKQWNYKLASEKLRLIFVGRLISEKGVTLLLDALRLLRPKSLALVSCDILGEGPLLAQCKDAAETLKGRIEMKILGTVEYGLPLFNLLSRYDALLVPSVSNEQPRIVYDGFARALPILGFRTEGLASCVSERVTGRLCRKASARELADLIEWGVDNRHELARMGMAGLSVARSLTHREMHQRRCKILAHEIQTYGRAGR